MLHITPVVRPFRLLPAFRRLVAVDPANLSYQQNLAMGLVGWMRGSPGDGLTAAERAAAEEARQILRGLLGIGYLKNRPTDLKTLSRLDTLLAPKPPSP